MQLHGVRAVAALVDAQRAVDGPEQGGDGLVRGDAWVHLGEGTAAGRLAEGGSEQAGVQIALDGEQVGLEVGLIAALGQVPEARAGVEGA